MTYNVFGGTLSLTQSNPIHWRKKVNRSKVLFQSINQSINQSISMNLLWRPTSKALGRQKYSENTTA